MDSPGREHEQNVRRDLSKELGATAGKETEKSIEKQQVKQPEIEEEIKQEQEVEGKQENLQHDTGRGPSPLALVVMKKLQQIEEAKEQRAEKESKKPVGRGIQGIISLLDELMNVKTDLKQGLGLDDKKLKELDEQTQAKNGAAKSREQEGGRVPGEDKFNS